MAGPASGLVFYALWATACSVVDPTGYWVYSGYLRATTWGVGNLTGDSKSFLRWISLNSASMRSSWSADSAIPKFGFFAAPKLGLAKEFGFLAKMIVGFDDDAPTPMLEGLGYGFDVAAAEVMLPSISPSSLDMNSSMSCCRRLPFILKVNLNY